jgi:hypothetical protein
MLNVSVLCHKIEIFWNKNWRNLVKSISRSANWKLMQLLLSHNRPRRFKKILAKDGTLTVKYDLQWGSEYQAPENQTQLNTKHFQFPVFKCLQMFKKPDDSIFFW